MDQPQHLPPAVQQLIESHAELAAFGAAALQAAATLGDESALLNHLLPHILQASSATAGTLMRGERGRWTTVASAAGNDSGAAFQPPEQLLAEALDAEQAIVAAPWAVAPLPTIAAKAEVLAVRRDDQPLVAEYMAALAALLAAALDVCRGRVARQGRIARLKAVLEITSQWSQTHRTDQLLEQMAETSTRLLQAERASIFLWDRANKMLVGRPALGVEGGELRIADDAGVVGEVVQTATTCRVDTAEAGQEVDRTVDEQLGFRTRNLLCAPLRDAAGQMLGAFEMINKIDGDFSDDDAAALEELAAHAAVAIKNTRQRERLIHTRNRMADEAAAGVRLIGECQAMQAVRERIERVADTDLSVLILGDNGSGKEVVAQMIHFLSGRRNEPFVAVNCAAIAESLLESELFGHEKGAFTDARETRLGKFELAGKGTLLLDEIGDMSLGGQAKLLRVLEEKVLVRVGGIETIAAEARVIAATNQDLTSLVGEKLFREDLFFRLNVVAIELPPLRARDDDVLLLADHFMQQFCAKANRPPPQFTSDARRRLVAHPWPGNIRELRNVIERLVYLTDEASIDAKLLAQHMPLGAAAAESAELFDAPLTEATRLFQVRYIEHRLAAAGGNISEAAERMGVQRSNLYRKMDQLGINRE